MNERWAKLIIDHLVEHGVRLFCVAPGSRVTPLSYAISQDDRIKKLVHFDERGLAFHALGYAKASKTPVAVFCTTGTAAANFFPAVMEAHHDGVPLIFITADRPPELQESGANQTCDQTKLYGDYVRWAFTIPCPNEQIPDNFIGSTIAQAVYRANHAPKGPVQLNCLFREPFFSGSPLTIRSSTHYETSHATLSTSSSENWGRRLSQAERGVIIVGNNSTSRPLKSIFTLAEHLHWPILADVLSGVRSDSNPHNVIPYYDTILKSNPNFHPDFVLHLGDRFVSKTLLQWLDKCKVPTYALVADHPCRHDPLHFVTHRIQCDPTLFCEQVLPFVSRRASWHDQWQAQSDAIENQLDHLTGTLTEPGLIRFLQSHLPAYYSLFLASSMPIRDADAFFFPRFYRGPIFGNRGVSGIDGNIATAIGIAQGSQRPTLAVLGDLTALHDINSLAQLQKAKHPVIFLIINNGGGGIFSFLPIAEKKEFMEEYVAAAHNFQFENGAKMFNLPFHPLTDFSTLSRAFKEEKSCILELKTNRDENYALHKEIQEKLSKCLESTSCMVS